jgi:hypothetical protein
MSDQLQLTSLPAELADVAALAAVVPLTPKHAAHSTPRVPRPGGDRSTPAGWPNGRLWVASA